MFHGFPNAFAVIGLVLVAFSVRIRSTPAITSSSNQSMSPLRDPLKSGTFDTSSAVNDKSDHTDWQCGVSPKIIEIEINDKTIGSSRAWNYYDIIDPNRKWDHTDLTYSVIDYRNFDENSFDWLLHYAFQLWCDAAPELTFTQLENGRQDVDIKFKIVGAFRQTTITPVAKSFKPYYNKHTIRILGDLHWTTDSEEGGNLLVITTHEIGHALGIKHSTVEEAIMFFRPRYMYRKSVSLHKDDKAAIRKLYGGEKSDPDTSSAEYVPNGEESLPSSEESV